LTVVFFDYFTKESYMPNRLFTILGSIVLSTVLLVANFGTTRAQATANSTVISLSQLEENEIFLKGPYDTFTVTFGVPADWKLTAGSQLDLHLLSALNAAPATEGPALYGGTVTVKFNRDTVAILPIYTIGDFDFSVPIPAYDMISPRPDGQMELRFELDSGATCTFNQNMDVVISASSQLSVSHEDRLPDTDLVNFPSPIFQGSIYPDNALIVVPDHPTAMEIQSATTVAAGLANLTSGKLNVELATLSQMTAEQETQNHLIFVGKAASLPDIAKLTLPLPSQNGKFSLRDDPDSGVIQMVNSPWNPKNVVLVVGGNTDAGTVKAAQALSTGIIHSGAFPNLAIVKGIQDMAVSDSLIVDQTLGDLGYQQELLEGRGIDSTNFNIYIPPGTVLSSDAYFELNYGHSALLDYDTSGLVVLFNNQPIGSVRFTDETSQHAINQTRITIPPSIALPGNNVLEIRSSLEPANNCTDPALRGLWAVIWPESGLNLPFRAVQPSALSILDLRMYPAPIIFDATLGNTAFVIQKDAPGTWNNLIHIASYLGDHSNGSIYTPRVIFDDEISKDDLAKYDLIVVGLPSKLSIMKELNDSLPIPFDLETNATRDNYSQVTYLIPPDAAFGYVELLQSPWNPDNFVITALGNTPEGVMNATTALYDAKLRGQLAGNFAAINGEKVQTADTRLGLPLEDVAVTQEAVNPLEPQPEKVDLSTPTIDRPVWLLIAIQAVVVLIVVMVLLVFFSQWRRSRRK
jgi:hypothetical protein